MSDLNMEIYAPTANVSPQIRKCNKPVQLSQNLHISVLFISHCAYLVTLPSRISA